MLSNSASLITVISKFSGSKITPECQRLVLVVLAACSFNSYSFQYGNMSDARVPSSKMIQTTLNSKISS